MMQTAFSITKSKWRRFPLIELDNLQDLSEVTSYRGKFPYVWVKKKNIDIQNNFNWNFIPNENDSNKIHTFPNCNPYSKRPISWEILKLVPTTEHDDQIEVRCNQIASYKYTNNCMYVYAYHDKFVMKKYGMLSINERPSHLINGKKSMLDILESLSEEDQPFWLIHADVRIDNVQSLDYEIGDNVDAITFPVLHQSTSLTYADQSVMFCKPSYVKKMLNVSDDHEAFMIDSVTGDLVANPYYGKDIVNVVEVSTAKESIGYINDTVDPFRAWANAYYTTIHLEYTNSKNKNKIMTAYTKLKPSRVNDLIVAGMQEAQIDIAKENYSYKESSNWDYILKRFGDWNNKTSSETSELLDKRIERIKQIYGEDSEEYQKLSSQLGKSSL